MLRVGDRTPDEGPTAPVEEAESGASNIETADKARSVGVFKTMGAQRKMRLLSESALDGALDWHLEDGAAYHCISCGDVDSLTYLRHVAKSVHLDYVLLSTWCMATVDAEEMRDWVRRGIVCRFDYYVGEIFKSGYRGCRDVLDETCAMCGGRVARFRNHSKLMAFFSPTLSGVIEPSANADTTPRTEQTCITCDRGLAEFYKAYFDGIRDYDGGYGGWEPWHVPDSR